MPRGGVEGGQPDNLRIGEVAEPELGVLEGHLPEDEPIRLKPREFPELDHAIGRVPFHGP